MGFMALNELATLLLDHLNEKYSNYFHTYDSSIDNGRKNLNIIFFGGDKYKNHFATVSPDTVYLFAPNNNNVECIIKAADPELLTHIEHYVKLYLGNDYE